jgi:hypothetical protein
MKKFWKGFVFGFTRQGAVIGLLLLAAWRWSLLKPDAFWPAIWITAGIAIAVGLVLGVGSVTEPQHRWPH